MASVIWQGSSGAIAAEVNNGGIARVFSDTSWATLRLAVRLAWKNRAAGFSMVSAAPYISIGFCKGVQSFGIQANTGLWYGFATTSNAAVGAGATVGTTNNSLYFAHNGSGQSTTNDEITTTTWSLPTTDSGTDFGMLILEMTNVAGTFTMKGLIGTSTTLGDLVVTPQEVADTAQLSTLARVGYTLKTSPTWTPTSYGTYGPLDGISIYSPGTSASLLIDSVAIYKVA